MRSLLRGLFDFGEGYHHRRKNVRVEVLLMVVVVELGLLVWRAW